MDVSPSTKIPPGALPRSEPGRLDWLQLTRSRRVGPATFIRLIREHGSAGAALEALPGLAAEAGVRDYAAAPRAAIEAEWRAAAAVGARPLLLGAPDYPPLLATTADAPAFLWALGDPGWGARRGVALVGARNASALGCRMASRLARELGEAGFTVTSGLARGIDAAAHRGALDTGTIAVQAGGVDIVYPPENAALAADIAARGLRLSEMPMGHEPKAQDFPRRNRIISGLALGLVVIEGATRSGSLITARAALDQGREIMAVPGSPMDARAGGCNQLIREGAILVQRAEDVIELVTSFHGTPRSTFREDGESYLAEDEGLDEAGDPGAIAALLTTAPVAVDELVRLSGQGAGAVQLALIELELAGRLTRHAGGRVSLT